MHSRVSVKRQLATSPELTQGIDPPQYLGIFRDGVPPTRTSAMSSTWHQTQFLGRFPSGLSYAASKSCRLDPFRLRMFETLRTISAAEVRPVLIGSPVLGQPAGAGGGQHGLAEALEDQACLGQVGPACGERASRRPQLSR
jgi:hypothetical protein